MNGNGNVYFSEGGKMQGAIYLASDGTLQEFASFHDRFLKEIPYGGHLLYIPYAMKNNPKYSTCANDFYAILLAHGRTDIQMHMGEDFSQIRQLTSFSAVVIEAGDTDILMNELDRTGFEFVLDNFSRHGGVIYGRSTGGIVLGKYIDTCRDVNQEFKTGCGMIGKYSFCPNYHNENKDGWASRHDSHLICASTGVGVMIKDGRIEWSNSRGYKIFEL
jgi:peptidase E